MRAIWIQAETSILFFWGQFGYFLFAYLGHRIRLFPSEYPSNILFAFVTSSLKQRTNNNNNNIIIIIIIIIIILDQLTVDWASKWIKIWTFITVFGAINCEWQITRSEHYIFNIMWSDTDNIPWRYWEEVGV